MVLDVYFLFEISNAGGEDKHELKPPRADAQQRGRQRGLPEQRTADLNTEGGTTAWVQAAAEDYDRGAR
jgi:hypothetical protein